MSIEPDTKDWTWVLDRECPECGLVSGDIDPQAVPDLVLGSIGRWQSALGRADAALRSDPTTWSVVEYACHVRDVLDLFAVRMDIVRERDDPVLENWDQDATAVERRYDRQSARLVARELPASAARAASAFGRLTGDEWGRPARRSNGSTFTARTLAQYFWHDVAHHLHDVCA